MGVQGLFSNTSPSNCTLEMTLQKFSEIKLDTVMKSFQVSKFGRVWCLNVRRITIDEKDCLSAHLCLDSGILPITVTWKLQILHFRTGKVIEEYNAGKYQYNEHNGRGFPKLDMQTVRDKGGYLLVDDQITFRCEWEMV